MKKPNIGIRRRLVAGIHEAVGDAVATLQVRRRRQRQRRPHRTEIGERLLQGLTAHELMYRFESLGDNCEFGIVQRRCGAEPLGLFRFATAAPENVARAIDADFAGIDAPDVLKIELEEGTDAKRPYYARNYRYDLSFHTGFSSEQAAAEYVHRDMVRRLGFLARKLRGTLFAGSRILVCRARDDDNAAALRLGSALARKGPNLLLWVAPAQSEAAIGRLAPIADGILKGWIEPDSDWDRLALDTWLGLCERAYSYWCAARGEGLAAETV